MKSIFIAAGILLSGLCLKAQTDSITISGTITGAKDNKIVVYFKDQQGKSISASVIGLKDKFSLKVPSQQVPVAARLTVYVPIDPSVRMRNPSPAGDVFVGKSNLKVSGHADQLDMAVVTGDKENDAYAAFVKKGSKADLRRQELTKKIWNKEIKLSAADSVALHKEYRELSMNRYSRQREFVKTNPDAFASVFMLSRLTSFYTADNYLAAWNALSPTYKNSEPGEEIKKQLKKMEHTMAGTPAFAFERLDKDGNKVSPELLKGKTYLLDFWGSWCGPCRASHPHLKELYAKYKDKGFEIVAIAHERGKALEECKASWSKAIEEDQINWVHILNQDGIEQQNVVSTYHVSSFPTKILIGADGKIILRISGSATDDVDKALERIYGF